MNGVLGDVQESVQTVVKLGEEFANREAPCVCPLREACSAFHRCMRAVLSGIERGGRERGPELDKKQKGVTP